MKEKCPRIRQSSIKRRNYLVPFRTLNICTISNYVNADRSFFGTGFAGRITNKQHQFLTDFSMLWDIFQEFPKEIGVTSKASTACVE